MPEPRRQQVFLGCSAQKDDSREDPAEGAPEFGLSSVYTKPSWPMNMASPKPRQPESIAEAQAHDPLNMPHVTGKL